MVDFKIDSIDSKDVSKKLEGTTVKMPSIIIKMQLAVNRNAIKAAKLRFKSLYDSRNHAYNLKPDMKNILQSFKTYKSKYSNTESLIRNLAFYSVFLEKGATLKPKNQKFLTFIGTRKDGTKGFIKIEGATLPAKPFLEPEVKKEWNSDNAVYTQEKVLQKALDNYWKKQGV